MIIRPPGDHSQFIYIDRIPPSSAAYEKPGSFGVSWFGTRDVAAVGAPRSGDSPRDNFQLVQGFTAVLQLALVSLRIETVREADGRWTAEVIDLLGVMVYSDTRENAIAAVKDLAKRVIADCREHGEAAPEPVFSIA